ncbi:MAG: hypothetical protein NVS4B4_04730 [Bradyrhizobium sp.]
MNIKIGAGIAQAATEPTADPKIEKPLDLFMPMKRPETEVNALCSEIPQAVPLKC